MILSAQGPCPMAQGSGPRPQATGPRPQGPEPRAQGPELRAQGSGPSAPCCNVIKTIGFYKGGGLILWAQGPGPMAQGSGPRPQATGPILILVLLLISLQSHKYYVLGNGSNSTLDDSLGRDGWAHQH